MISWFKKLFLLIILIAFYFGALVSAQEIENQDVAANAGMVPSVEDPDDIDFGGNSTQVVKDPLEKMNRKVFAFNEVVDINLFDPIAKGYRNNVPKLARRMLGNFLTNIKMPFVTINSILQGKADNSMGSFSSFLINSTIGIGGLFDVAGYKKITYNNEDLGQTFAKYGMPRGPYLVIPLLGPSTVRDFSGYGIERVVDPFGFNIFGIGHEEKILPDAYLITIAGLSALNTRESLIDILDDARKNSFDLYATIRSAYLQRRDFEISK
jgi:phospholipid-binding lipoprotein MlaA